MYLVYLDDSEANSAYQLVGGIIVPDHAILSAEKYLEVAIETFVPPELQSDFEFHACDLHNLNPPFQRLPRTKAMELLEICVSFVAGMRFPIIIGGVNLKALKGGLHRTASQLDIAFRLCALGVEKWLADEELRTANECPNPDPMGVLGLMICDAGGKTNHHVGAAFRSMRRRSREGSTGELLHLHDDMYFGDSKYCTGIQLADVCTYVVLRHLLHKSDTEYLYDRISPLIQSCKIDLEESLPKGIMEA